MVSSEALKVIQREGLSPPEILTIAITGACNLTCRHCWVRSGEPSAAGHLPERTVRRLVEEFMALGGEGVRFTGGEPLCHPAWLKLLQFGRSLGLGTVAIQTNGMLFTDDMVAALRDLAFPQLSLQISLDGATAASHDAVRGEGAFAGTMTGLRRLVKGGLGRQVQLFCTEMRHNLQEIPDLLRLADQLGLGSVKTGALVRCGRAEEETGLESPDLADYQQLLQRYDADPEFQALYERLGTVAAIEWRQEEAPRNECCTFVRNPYLTATGRLYPCVLCHADEYAVTGVLGKNLAAAFAEGAPRWRSLLELSLARAASLTSCRDCPGRDLCAGGCLGRAWASCGDFSAADDRCQIRRAIYDSSQK
ncbi:MAG TPA: radical SAM protein [Geobacteraceae bacterium]